MKVRYTCFQFTYCTRDEIRTRIPEGTTPSRWRVYQFHHPGRVIILFLTNVLVTYITKPIISSFFRPFHKQQLDLDLHLYT